MKCISFFFFLNYAFWKRAHLNHDHRQRIYIRLVRRLFLLGVLRFRDIIETEELRSAVTDRVPVVCGRGIERFEIPRDRTEAEIRKTGIALRVDQNISLWVIRSARENDGIFYVRSSNHHELLRCRADS